MLNTVAIIAIVIVVLIFLNMYKNNLYADLDEGAMDYDESMNQSKDIKFFTQETSKAFSRTLRQNLEDDNLTKDELRAKKKRITALRESLTKAAYGDIASKRLIKNNIKELILDPIYEVDEDNIDDILSFDNPDRLSANDKFEILLYMYEREFGQKGFDELMKEHRLSEPHYDEDGAEEYKVTKEDISEVYENIVMRGQTSVLKTVNLTFFDKIEIISQRIYEKYIGLGAADMLYHTSIDEIDVGVSGIPDGGYTLSNIGSMPYSYESVWIVYHGLNIHMQCLSFETQEELIRVCDNIYKYEAPYVMSRSQGRVLSTMIDGSRIVVTRPPFAESYMFFLRKFDSAPSVKPAVLVHDENKAIPIAWMKWLIKGQRNIAITGGTGTGKTTWLKSVIRFIAKHLNIRLNEERPELNLRFTYPERNIASFAETAMIGAQEGLDLQKKTNGAVNIIGEVAKAIQATFVIQTAMVNSLFAMFTHHAKTASALVEAISNNLLECGLYKDKKDAVAMTAKVLNIDCHLENTKGYRHIARITEIIPITDNPYPSLMLKDDDPRLVAVMNYEDDEVRVKAMQEIVSMDTTEYYHRVTDPKLYETVDIVQWEAIYDGEGNVVSGTFKMVNRPSKKMMDEITDKLTPDEEKAFRYDMDMMERMSNGDTSEEVKAWEAQILAS